VGGFTLNQLGAEAREKTESLSRALEPVVMYLIAS